ncbi:MAG: DUF2007 domain-containing protein [Phycisphaera sp.]|nr:DUF2007 domain-containing protein [Phycisphaera sp.]
MSQDDPVDLTTAPNEMEAGILVAHLAAHDIQAFMVGEMTAGLRAEAPGVVQLLVRPSDLERAHALLTEWRDEPIEYEWPDFPDDAEEPTE